MANAFESITEVVTETGYTVRVWETQDAEGDYDATHNATTELIRANATSKESIAGAIRSARPNWAAYEIKDKFGNGRVVYASWP